VIFSLSINGKTDRPSCDDGKVSLFRRSEKSEPRAKANWRSAPEEVWKGGETGLPPAKLKFMQQRCRSGGFKELRR